MKVPAVPPPFVELVSRLSPERLGRAVGAVENVMSGPYLPWDSMRFRTPPDGLDVEEWWTAVRLLRRSVARPIPDLVDQAGAPFTYTLPDELLRRCDDVTRRASGSIAISEQVTNPSTRDRYVVSSLMEEAITSSQLEGAATSRRVAKEMIRSGRDPRSIGERMILNNYLAMQQIVELRDAELTPDLVRRIHRIVTDGTLENPDSAGAIQSDDAERIAVWGDGDQLLYRPPPVAELPESLQRLCDFANGGDSAAYLPPVLRAVAVHFMVGYDHYFEDGNGRTARALFYWSMLREGFWLTEFLTISRILKTAPTKYARSFLLTEDDDGDLTHFFLHQMAVIVRAIDDLHSFLAKKATELQQVQREIRARPGEFNSRQLAVLEHVLRNPDAVVTARSHAQSHRVSEQSARNDLAALETRDLMDRIRVGKFFAWVPADRMAERLTRAADG